MIMHHQIVAVFLRSDELIVVPLDESERVRSSRPRSNEDDTSQSILDERPVVRVVPVEAVLGRLPFVDERLAVCDRVLRDTRNTVGPRCAELLDAVPVEGDVSAGVVVDGDLKEGRSGGSSRQLGYG